MARWHTRLRAIWAKMEGMPETHAQREERERIAPNFDKGVALMKEMVRALSGSGSINAELLAGMLAEFAREHATNQQSVVRSLVTLLQNWVCDDMETGKPAEDCDPRRSEAWKFATRLVNDDPGFPYI